jgi:hypothetical protein
MNASQSVCPQCHQDVSFERARGRARCPLCGFQYELQSPPPPGSPPPGIEPPSRPFLEFFKFAGIGLLVLLGMGALLLGLVYLGCSVAHRGM